MCALQACRTLLAPVNACWDLLICCTLARPMRLSLVSAVSPPAATDRRNPNLRFGRGSCDPPVSHTKGCKAQAKHDGGGDELCAQQLVVSNPKQARQELLSADISRACAVVLSCPSQRLGSSTVYTHHCTACRHVRARDAAGANFRYENVGHCCRNLSTLISCLI